MVHRAASPLVASNLESLAALDLLSSLSIGIISPSLSLEIGRLGEVFTVVEGGKLRIPT